MGKVLVLSTLRTCSPSTSVILYSDWCDSMMLTYPISYHNSNYVLTLYIDALFFLSHSTFYLHCKTQLSFSFSLTKRSKEI